MIRSFWNPCICLGSQAGVTLDTVVRNEINGGTNVIYQPKSAGTAVTSRATLDATCTLTVDTVFKAAAQLKANNAKGINGGAYVAIIHPHVAKDLMAAATGAGSWMDINKYTNPEAIYNGEIGKIGNVRFVESSEAKIWSGDGCPTGLAVYSVLVVGEGAYGVSDLAGGGIEHIVKQKGSSGTADPLNQRSTVGWKATKVAKRLAEEYMVRIECTSSFSSTGIRKLNLCGERSAAPRFLFLMEEFTMAESATKTETKTMVTVKLPRINPRDPDLYVAVNGEAYLIKRGESVQVPDYIKEVIDHSDEMANLAQDYIDAVGKG